MFDNDVVPLMAGMLANMGFIGITPAYLAAAVGALAGDCGFFLIGWIFSRRVRRSRFYRRIGPRVEKLVGRVGIWELFPARFVYGIRYVSMLYWGVQRYPAHKFLAINAVGCAAWVGLLVSAGFFMTHAAAVILGQIRRLEIWLGGTVLIGVLGYLLLRRVWRKLSPA